MVQNYIVDKLTLSDLKENGKVVIPAFQRGVVWTKQHRKEFIETVKSGDPFGVVLVSQETPSDPYCLIDGLQRLSTLRAYMDNPLEFIDENDKFIDKEKVREIFVKKYEFKGMQLPSDAKLSKEEKTFLKKTIALMKSYKSMPDAMELWPTVAEYLNVDENVFKVLSPFSAFIQSFKEQLNLPDIIIHAIVYQGPKERLPYVFETLNTSSVSLTKYEVFSSQWPTLKIIVQDEDIVQNVWKKYADLKKSSSFEVDVDIESIRNEGMTLFEYCFGFSEIVCDETKDYAFLFNKGKKTTNPTGFELLALVCGLAVNKADVLYKDDYLGGLTASTLVKLKEAIIESIRVVSGALRKWVIDLRDTPIKNSGTYQIYYMICSVFKNMYHFEPKTGLLESDVNEEWINGFKKNSYKWYFYHLVTGFWNLHRQTSDLHSLLHDDYDSNLYSAGISRETWDEVINTFYTNIRSSAVSRTISNESKLFLNYYYKMLIDEDANRERYFKKHNDE